MSTPQSPFRYFRDPHHFSNYTPVGERCPFCSLKRPGYSGGFYGEAEYDSYDFICEVCLRDGKLIERGLKLNEGYDLELRERYPELPDVEAAALTQERTVELEQRTPAIMAWQSLIWPAHCGDFCCFVKEAGQLDMTELAPDGDGRRLFEEHMEERQEDVWEKIRPDTPTDNSKGYSVGVYLFQCLECAEYLITWDCD